MEQKISDVIIIGGGPGGYTAALYSARANLKTMVIEKLSAGGQMATTSQVDNYPGFEEGVNGFELGEKMRQGAERFGVESLFAEVESVDLSAHPKVIHTSDGDYFARTVILATGANPREMGLEEEQKLKGRGVAYCATCDGMFYRNKTVVVVGGGNTAVADALFLSKICNKVYLVHRRDRLRASKSYMSALQQSLNIEFIWNAKVKEILHDKKVTGVVTEDIESGDTIKVACDGVFVAIGRIPNTDLFKGQLELDEGGYIVADETTKQICRVYLR